MRHLQRLSLMTGMCLTLSGCGHHSQVIVLDEPAVQHGVIAAPYQSEVCCLGMHYPGAALWLDYCYGPVAHLDHPRHGALGGVPPVGLGPPRPCSACSQPAELNESPCATGHRRHQPHEQAEPTPVPRSPDEPLGPPAPPEPSVSDHPPVPDLPVADDSGPRLEPPALDTILQPLVDQPTIEPPDNELPSRSLPRKPSESIDATIHTPGRAAPAQQSTAGSDQTAEIPRNDLPPLRIRVKLTSDRIESK
jgi:hypothetical protein